MRSTFSRCRVFLAFVGAAALVSVGAQTPPAPNPAKQAVELRQATYKLIGANFKPIGDVLQGRAAYAATDVKKRATRVAFLSELANENFPDISNTGLPNTKAKADIWSERADFDKRLAEFAQHARALAQVAAQDSQDKLGGDAFKSAAGALAQDCRGCHDKYREK